MCSHSFHWFLAGQYFEETLRVDLDMCVPIRFSWLLVHTEDEQGERANLVPYIWECAQARAFGPIHMGNDA